VGTGGDHCFLQLESGEVYACGLNEYGQLGLGDNRNRNRWQRVVAPGIIEAVVLGGYHSFLQLATGEVYGCGANSSGQLGLEANQDSSTWQLTKLAT
jgi:alpha-tubulin suppressor-like RCC1 family protein